MAKYLLFLAACCGGFLVHAQELYPYTEPASNVPARSLSVKLGAMYMRDEHYDEPAQRYASELTMGLSKSWMLRAGATFSDMHGKPFGGESVRLYTKYRFLSKDDVHKHFRMAAFALGSYTRNRPEFNELNLMGDQSGVQAGLIATQLIHKLAISGTVSLTEVLAKERRQKFVQDLHPWAAVNYSLSAGYLLFPFSYTSYRQTNINLYAELLGSRNLAWPSEKQYIDLAPSVQFIFNSAGKLNIGYRFQLAGDILRMSERSFMISYEHLFLNAFRRKDQ